MSETTYLFDAEVARLGTKVLRPARILVRGDDVLHCGPAMPELPDNTLVIKAGAIVPPLVDHHVHLFLHGGFDPGERAATASLGRKDALDRILGILKQYRLRGVGRVRDGGDPQGLALEAAKIANSNPGLYATVFPSGEPVWKKGKYGGFLGRGVASLKDAAELIEENAGKGAAQIKILATGLNSLDKPGETGGPQFTGQELSEIIKIARANGLPAMVHANGPLAWIAKAGPETIEHGFWMEEEDLRVMADCGVSWTPTLGAWAELSRNPALTEAQLQVVKATDARQREMLAKVGNHGVKVLAGSDAGTPGVRHVSGLLGEIGRLSHGLGMERTLLSATPETIEGYILLMDDPVKNPGTDFTPIGVYLGGAYAAIEQKSL